MSDTGDKEPVIIDLNGMIEYAEGGIVSKAIIDEQRTKTVLFSFKQGQCLSEHTASMPATIHVLEGHARILLEETWHNAGPGTYIYMPAGCNHAVDATEDMVFLLTLFRGAET